MSNPIPTLQLHLKTDPSAMAGIRLEKTIFQPNGTPIVACGTLGGEPGQKPDFTMTKGVSALVAWFLTGEPELAEASADVVARSLFDVVRKSGNWLDKIFGDRRKNLLLHSGSPKTGTRAVRKAENIRLQVFLDEVELPPEEFPEYAERICKALNGQTPEEDEEEPQISEFAANLNLEVLSNQTTSYLPVGQPGTLPFGPSSRVRVLARFSQPTHALLLWISSDGKAFPLHPWPLVGDWETIETAGPVSELTLPSRFDEKSGLPWGLPLQSPSGIETLVLALRTVEEGPFESGFLTSLNQRLGALQLPSPDVIPEDIAFAEAKPVHYPWNRKQASSSIHFGVRLGGQEPPTDHPVAQRNRLLQQLLGEHGQASQLHLVTMPNAG